MDIKRIGLYVRVSSIEQAEEGYSIGAQTEKLNHYCSAKNWSVYKTYTDPGYTGANINRPGMQQLIQDIKNHELDIVLVYKLDRFTRSQKDCITLLEDVLLPNNCDFVSINENFDTSTPYGRAMIGILSVFAQLERETIRERTIMGRVERAKSGLYSGNARLPIGYDYSDGKLVINEYEAMQIREMFDMYINGSSTSAIFNTFKEKGYTTKLGEWSNNSVIRRLLDSRLYCGEIKYKGEFYPGKHEPIISKETWELSQQVKKNYHENATGNRKNPFSSSHLLTGLIYCGNCGARMHGKTRSKHMNPEYMCYSFSKQSSKYITDPNCRARIWECWELEEAVFDQIHSLTFTSVKSIQKDRDKSSDILTIQRKIETLNRKQDKLIDLYLMDGISKSDIESKNAAISNEKALLEKSLHNIKLSSAKPSVKEVMNTLSKFDFIMEHGSIEDKKVLLSSLINKITVNSHEVDIEWNF